MTTGVYRSEVEQEIINEHRDYICTQLEILSAVTLQVICQDDHYGNFPDYERCVWRYKKMWMLWKGSSYHDASGHGHVHGGITITKSYLTALANKQGKELRTYGHSYGYTPDNDMFDDLRRRRGPKETKARLTRHFKRLIEYDIERSQELLADIMKNKEEIKKW